MEMAAARWAIVVVGRAAREEDQMVAHLLALAKEEKRGQVTPSMVGVVREKATKEKATVIPSAASPALAKTVEESSKLGARP